jgi:hypothetical protein
MIKSAAGPVDRDDHGYRGAVMRGAVRARLTLKLMGIVVLLVLTVLTAKACSGSGSGASPLNPLNIANNGVAGICADQHAVAASSDTNANANATDGSQSATSADTVISQSGLAQLGSSEPGGAAALEKTLGGNLSCPTTTTVGSGG